ncbi:MAG: SLATT domain-containing protein [Phycisphaerales bacterium]|nr:MAG: SLATT domain-containing protein [Phycisphaerales bacterium]
MAMQEGWGFDELPELLWKNGQLAEPLAKLCDYAIGTARNFERWYIRKRKWKKHWASILRSLAIVAAAAAGVIPLLGQIFAETAESGAPSTWLNPLWSGVALAFAALFVLFDRFWGYTSGWVRYVLAAAALCQETDMFQFDMESAKVSWGDEGPTREEAKALIGECKDFLRRVHTIVRRETDTWALDFQRVVKQIDVATEGIGKTQG